MTVDKVPNRAAISIAEMAQLCGLSRSRFYDLIEAGVFPTPIKKSSQKRPIYTLELQRKCLEVRSTGIGFNGEPVLFNRKPSTTRPPSRKGKRESVHGELVEAVRALGLNTTGELVASVLAELFPEGVKDIDPGEVVRAVFLRLQRKS